MVYLSCWFFLALLAILLLSMVQYMLVCPRLAMSPADTLRRRSSSPRESSMCPSSRLEGSAGRGLINSVMAWYFLIRSRFCMLLGAVLLQGQCSFDWVWRGLVWWCLGGQIRERECRLPRERRFRRRMMIAGYLMWWPPGPGSLWTWRWGPGAGSRGRRELGKGPRPRRNWGDGGYKEYRKSWIYVFKYVI